MSVAHNRCAKCAYEWHDAPGSLARTSECLRCESVYWERLNRSDRPGYCSLCDKEFQLGVKK